jgi:taurine dioxygenase
MSLEILPLKGRFAAEVGNVDLSKPIDDNTFQAIRAALLDHSVLVFHGQRLSNERHIAFSRRFGALEVHAARHYVLPEHPEILVLANRGEKGTAPIKDGGAYWHSDMTYTAKPPMGSLLYALEVPPEGGDTLYADMAAAYAALPEATKRCIATLKAVHRYADRYRKQQAKTNRPSLEATLATMPDAVHPVVRTHPEAGRKALFVSEGFTVAIVGLPEAEGRVLLDELNAHATRPEFVYAHKWRAGDLVIWDNRSTMHRATDYDDARFARTMHRTTVAGTVPF